MPSPEKVTINYRDHSHDMDKPASSEVVDANGIRVHVADARAGGEGPTYVIPNAFQAYADDPFEQQRNQMLASELGGRIIAIDTPGAGLDKRSTSRTTLRQKWDALRGRLDSQADTQVEALLRVLGTKEEIEKVHFIGYSLGAASVAAMLMSQKFAESKLEVGGVSFVETVNDQDWPLLGKTGLQASIAREVPEVDRYLVETKEAGYDVPAYERDPKDPTKQIKGKKLPMNLTSLLTGAGMRKGFGNRLAAHLKQGNLRDVPMTMYRANGSGVARPDTNQATAEALGARLVELHSPEGDKAHRHMFWHSMGAVAMLALEIAKSQKKD